MYNCPNREDVRQRHSIAATIQYGQLYEVTQILVLVYVAAMLGRYTLASAPGGTFAQ